MMRIFSPVSSASLPHSSFSRLSGPSPSKPEFQPAGLPPESQAFTVQFSGMTKAQKRGKALFEALDAREVNKLKTLLEQGTDPNRPSRNTGQTPLNVAANNRDYKSVELLLKHGADPNLASEDGDVPLSASVMTTLDTGIAQLLLARGANPNPVLEDSYPPLYWAVYHGLTNVVEALLEKGADVNVPADEARTPLCHASRQSKTKIARLLLEKGADPNINEDNTFSPLYYALCSKNHELIRLLIDHGANPNFKGYRDNTPLMLAAEKGLLKTAQVLLEKGADPDIVNKDGDTPLTWAIRKKKPALIKLLLEKGADPNASGKESPLYYAIHDDNLGLVKRLLEKGADPNRPDGSGTTLLYWPILYNKPKMVKLLLENGLDPNLTDKSGKPPLYRVRGNAIIAKLLQDKGADPSGANPYMELSTWAQNPPGFLQFMTLHQQHIEEAEIGKFYTDVEDTYPESWGKALLPELLALMPIYARKVGGEWFDEEMPGENSGEKLGKATAAITRLYNFISGPNRIDSVLGIVYSNWGRLGTLGLSFSRWKFDTMTQWKSSGPMEKPPLLIQSGMFKPVPIRADDGMFFRSFVHYDPASGLSIELRRAYIVVSKPGLGSLVIRNSSHMFGRDLLNEPAYYHPDKTYTQGTDLLDPKVLDSKNSGYMNVLGKKLNQTEASQEKHHGNIQQLLTDFQGVMDQYTDWKCGFREGKIPAGFKAMLEAAVLSASHGGLTSPFMQQENVRLAPRLAWINPYELPAPVSSLKMSDPAVLKEAELYLKVLKGQAVLSSSDDYIKQMPQLMAFLSQGARQGLELVLIS